MKHNSGAAGSKQSGGGVRVPQLACIFSFCALFPWLRFHLADRAVVFHYPRLSQSPMSPGLERSGVAWCGVAQHQAVHQADASSMLDCLVTD